MEKIIENEKKFILKIQNIHKDLGISENKYFLFHNVISFPFNAKIFIILVIALYYEEYITKDQMISIFGALLIIGAFKHMAKRKRPFQKYHKDIKNKEKMELDNFSFPSGHTLASVILLNVLRSNGFMVSSIYSLIPIFVAFSRVSMGVHYPSDVLVGLMFNYIF